MLHGFVWSKVACVVVGISYFESTGIYSFKRNRVPEILFSIYDDSETVTYMQTAPLNLSLVCVPCTSVAKSQNVLPISAEPTLSTLSTILRSETSPLEISASRLLQKISLLPKIPGKYSIKNSNTCYC